MKTIFISKLLWLDDLRDPFLNIEKLVPETNVEIHWVRNFKEFTEWIDKWGLPEIISFDHDLADEHYTPQEYWSDYEKSKQYQDAQTYTEPTGKDCAKWLVNYCTSNFLALPVCFVHSANPVGSDYIKEILNINTHLPPQCIDVEDYLSQFNE